MGTTADKLNKVLQTKEAIKQAIINKGVEVLDTEAFSTYPTKIDNIQAGGGEGELVYAYNGIGREIVKNDKVFLNKHNKIQDYRSPKLDITAGTRAVYIMCFDHNNNFITENVRQRAGNGYRNQISWNGKSFDMRGITGGGYSNSDDKIFVRSFNDENIICYNNRPYANNFQKKQGMIIEFSQDRSYIGKGYWATHTNPVDIYDKPQDGEKLCSLQLSGTWFCIYFFGNQLYISAWSTRYLYDFSNPRSPIQLRTFKFDPNADSQAQIAYMTGCNPGDYVISSEGINEVQNVTFKVWKINPDFSFSLANDLPETLQKFVGRTVYVRYYNDANLMTICSNVYEDGANLFKFENGQFHQIPLNVEILTNPDGRWRQPFRFDISQDGTTAYIADFRWYSNSATIFGAAYKIKVADDGWYAETIQQVTEDSICGIATGNKNDQGLYEINKGTSLVDYELVYAKSNEILNKDDIIFLTKNCQDITLKSDNYIETRYADDYTPRCFINENEIVTQQGYIFNYDHKTNRLSTYRPQFYYSNLNDANYVWRDQDNNWYYRNKCQLSPKMQPCIRGYCGKYNDRYYGWEEDNRVLKRYKKNGDSYEFECATSIINFSYSNYCDYALIRGNKISISGYDQTRIYDISDDFNPVQAYYSSTDVVYDATGFEKGDLLFTKDGIQQISEGNIIVPYATPDSIKYFTDLKYNYNPVNNVLMIKNNSNKKEVKFFLIAKDTKTDMLYLKDLIINIKPEEYPLQEYSNLYMYISDSMSKLFMRTDSYFAYYKLSFDDGNWYAYKDISSVPVELFTGIVTGEKDDQNRYEISVALPASISTTVNINEIPDEIIFNGDKL